MKNSQTTRRTIFSFILILIAGTKIFAAGDLDTTFTAGVAVFSGNSAASVVKVQADGCVLVGGSFRVLNGRSAPGLVRLNADGTIDQSFNIGTGFNLGAAVNAIAMQTDGKILVGGRFTFVFNGETRDFLVRLNSDGSLDTTFNMGGTGIGGFDVGAITLQANGQILVGGDFSSYNGVTTGRLARLNSDGSLDTTFATNLGTGFNQRVYTIAVEPDGQIVVGGNFSNVNGTTARLIARLNGSGTLDTAFTTNGGTGFPTFVVIKVLLQTNGQILVGGRFDQFNGTPRTDLLRLNADGTLDMNFTPAVNNVVLDLLIQADGQIIAAGNASFGAMQERTLIARLNQSDGSLDLTFVAGTTYQNTNSAINSIAFQLDGSIFAAGGFTTFSGNVRSALVNLNGANGSLNLGFSTVIGAGGQVNDLLVLPDNKILIGGDFGGVNESFRATVARLNADGSTDTTFNAGLGAVAGGVNTLAVQPLDGKIIVVGNFQMFGGVNNFGITRLNPDGSIDATFNHTAARNVEAIAIQPDGRIVIGGNFGIARLNADGTTDATFNNGGAGFDSNVEAVILQPNGQILVGGSFSTYNGAAGVNDLARLNSNGSLDTAFSTNVGSGVDLAGVFSLALQTDGRIVVGGAFSNFNGTPSGSIVRLNTDGTRDTNFNVGGAGFNNGVNDLALQPDGRILAVGGFTEYNSIARSQLARLNTNGSLDTSFRSGVAPNSNMQAVGVQCDGRILIGGLLQSYDNTPRFGIARVTAGDTITFTGAADMNWNNPANWSTGFVPSSTDNAIIPGGFNVNLSGGNFSVLTLTLGANSTLTIAAGSSLTTENVTNNGTIAGAGTFNFIGTALTNNGTISASAVNVNFNMNCAGFSLMQSKILIGMGAFVGNILTVASGVTLSLQDTHQFNQINVQGIFDATSRTISLSGADSLQGAGSVVIPFSTFIFNGSTPQTIAALNYHNLTLNNPAGVTGVAGLTVQGLLRVQQGTFTNSSGNYNNVQIDGGAILAGTNATTINVSGNWTNNGTFTANGNTVSFNGSAAQTIGGASATDFDNLTINNSSGVTFGSNSTVANLTLSNGNLSLGVNTLTITGAITRTSGHVIGNVRKNLVAGNNFTFAVGTANGYSPVTVNLTSGTTEVTVSVTQSNQPALNPATSLRRYWTLTSSGGTAFTADLTFNYLQADVFGNENIYRLTRVAGGVPQMFANNCAAGSPCVNTTANTAFISGVTQLSDWTLSEATPTKRRRFLRGSR